MQDHAVDIGSKTASIGGGAATLLFGLTANEVAAIVGAIVAVCGLIVQVWYTLEKRSRGKELHAAQLAALREGRLHGATTSEHSGTEEDR